MVTAGKSTGGRPAAKGKTMSQATATRRVEKLNTASLARIIDPDKDLPGALGRRCRAARGAAAAHRRARRRQPSTPERYVTFSRQALARHHTLGPDVRGDPHGRLRPADRRGRRLHRPAHHLPAARARRGDPPLAAVRPPARPARPGRAQPHRQLVHRPDRQPGGEPDHPQPGAALHDGAGRRGDPRPAAEAGGRAPRHRPVRARGQPLPPAGGGPAPVVRPHPPARGVGDRRRSSTRRSCGSWRRCSSARCTRT